MKDNKVYKVHTGIMEKNSDGVLEDQPNLSSYTLVAKDGEEAIKKAKKKLLFKTKEYIDSVEKITTLDE